jgi:hypothetical protein
VRRHLGRFGGRDAGDQVAGLLAGVGQVQGADLDLGAGLDHALQHLLRRDVARLERRHLLADQRDVAGGVTQQHAHRGLLLQGLARQHEAGALRHGAAGMDVDEQFFGLHRGGGGQQGGGDDQ